MLLYTSIIRVKALELSKGGINRAIKGVVNSVLKGGERIATRFEVLGPF